MLQKAAIVVVGLIWAQVAAAQSWVQVEAQPSAAAALERAEAYAQRLADVNAFRTGSAWHVIAIGPFATPDEARRRLLELRGQRVVPSDSFISDGRTFRDRIFGTGVASAAPQADPAQPAPVLEPGEETPQEARRSERNLSREDRALLQTALKFEGFYNSVIDAAFGPGTRRAMGDWQQANGFEPTGILTTLQRQELVNRYLDVQASLGIATYVDDQAGIEVELPLNMVRFDRYESPFVHFEAENEGVQLVLISQSGGEATLTALYDIMQTLRIAPIGSEAKLGRQSFTIEGTDDKVTSHIFARIAGGTVKGYALLWPADDAKRFRIALSAMQASFRTTNAALPDNAGGGVQDIDLLSGLEIRRADKTRSGFYIDSTGSVLTTSEAVQQCTRLTLDGDTDAEVVAAQQSPLGLAILRPVEPLAPLSVARLAAAQPRIQSDIAIAGYSFGGLLTAPSVTFGTLADLKGLDGDERVQRLSVDNEPSDAGGPVFDASGVVLGMLLDRAEGARQLPGDVAFAVDAPVLVEFLSANGVTPAAADPGETLPPEDLALLATDLTVLVSCWN